MGAGMSFGGDPFFRLSSADHEKAREIAAIIEKHVGQEKAPQFAALVSRIITVNRLSTGPNPCSEIALPSNQGEKL